jgi:hypothetical protein
MAGWFGANWAATGAGWRSTGLGIKFGPSFIGDGFRCGGADYTLLKVCGWMFSESMLPIRSMLSSCWALNSG